MDEVKTEEGDSPNPFAKLFCAICGEPSPAVHYGGLSCSGCAAFFKRVVLAHKPPKCAQSGDCPITTATRAECRACRYRKCLEEGSGKRKAQGRPARRKKPAKVKAGSSSEAPVRNAVSGSVRNGSSICGATGASSSTASSSAHLEFEDISNPSLPNIDDEKEEDIAALLENYGVDPSADGGLDGDVDILIEDGVDVFDLEKMNLTGLFGNPSWSSGMQDGFIPPAVALSDLLRLLRRSSEESLPVLSPQTQLFMHELVSSVTSTDVWRNPDIDCRPKITDNSFGPYAITSIIPETPIGDGFQFPDFMRSYWDVIKGRLGTFDETFSILRTVAGEVFSPTGMETAVELIGSILDREITPQEQAPIEEVVHDTRGLLSGVRHRGHEFIALTPGFDIIAPDDRRRILEDTCMESLLLSDRLFWEDGRVYFIFADRKIYLNGYGVCALFDRKFLDFAFEFGRRIIDMNIHEIQTLLLMTVVIFRQGRASVENSALLGFLHAYYLDLLLHTVSVRKTCGVHPSVFVSHLGELFALLNRSFDMSAHCKNLLKDVPPLFLSCQCAKLSPPVHVP